MSKQLKKFELNTSCSSGVIDTEFLSRELKEMKAKAIADLPPLERISITVYIEFTPIDEFYQ